MFRNLMNCDELIKFIMEEMDSYKYDKIEFQGDIIEVTETYLDYVTMGVIKGRCLITISQSADNAFDVHCIHGIVHFDKQYKCVVVPDYVKQEFLSTLAEYKV